MNKAELMAQVTNLEYLTELEYAELKAAILEMFGRDKVELIVHLVAQGPEVLDMLMEI